MCGCGCGCVCVCVRVRVHVYMCVAVCVPLQVECSLSVDEVIKVFGPFVDVGVCTIGYGFILGNGNFLVFTTPRCCFARELCEFRMTLP